MTVWFAGKTAHLELNVEHAHALLNGKGISPELARALLRCAECGWSVVPVEDERGNHFRHAKWNEKCKRCTGLPSQG